MPYVEKINTINDQEKDTLEDFREDSDIPPVLQSSLWDIGGDEITDYPNDYGNLKKDTPGVGETSAYSREPLVDLPTGIPESVSVEKSSVIQQSCFHTQLTLAHVSMGFNK
jgi:hypothetical protein